MSRSVERYSEASRGFLAPSAQSNGDPSNAASRCVLARTLRLIDPFDRVCVGHDMVRSATDIVQDVINAAVVDAIVALKDASQGLPNALVRDLASVHANTAFGDLPPAIQKSVGANVRDAFARLRKEGYVIAQAKSVQSAPPRSVPPGAGGRPDRPSPGATSRPGGSRRPPTSRGKR
jgi:hypothetical protein